MLPLGSASACCTTLVCYSPHTNQCSSSKNNHHLLHLCHTLPEPVGEVASDGLRTISLPRSRSSCSSSSCSCWDSRSRSDAASRRLFGVCTFVLECDNRGFQFYDEKETEGGKGGHPDGEKNCESTIQARLDGHNCSNLFSFVPKRDSRAPQNNSHDTPSIQQRFDMERETTKVSS